MRRIGLFLLVLLGLASIAGAQSAPVVTWTHPGTVVTRFQLQIGTSWFTELGMPTPSGTTYQATLPALPAGSYAVRIRACQGPDSSCVASDPLTVVKTVASGATNLSTRWVSPTGAATWTNCKSDTPLSGTAACSLDTMRAGTVTAGDTIYFRGGAYTYASALSLIVPGASGAIDARITYAAWTCQTHGQSEHGQLGPGRPEHGLRQV